MRAVPGWHWGKAFLKCSSFSAMPRVPSPTFLQSENFAAPVSGVLQQPPTVFSPSCLQQIQNLEQEGIYCFLLVRKQFSNNPLLTDQIPGCGPSLGYGKKAAKEGSGAGRALIFSNTKETPQKGPPGTSPLWDFVLILCSTDTKIKLEGSELINGMR